MNKSHSVISWGQLFILACTIVLFLFAITQRVTFDNIKIMPVTGYSFSGGEIIEYKGTDKVLNIPMSYSYGETTTKSGSIEFNDMDEAFDFLIENYSIGAEGYYDFYNQIFEQEYPWYYEYNINQYTYVEGDDFIVTGIAREAFKDNKSIEKIILPKTIEDIEIFAFQSCSNLKEIVFSEGLKSIGDSSFWGTSIEKLTLPESLEIIHPYAFFSCRKLQEVTIGSNVKEMTLGCFNDCENLETVYINSKYEIKSIYIDVYQTFSRCPKLKTIYVPEELLDYYKSDKAWCLYKDLYKPL